MTDERNIRRVALLGNHLPRQCGIATFTTDLSDAISTVAPDLDCFVLAMNDCRHQHNYPGRVRFELTDNDAGPFGGMKRSGLGRELGQEGLDAFQETKHVHIETKLEVKDWWYPYG